MQRLSRKIRREVIRRTSRRIGYKPTPNIDKLNEVKMELCKAIRRVAWREGWTQEQLAIYCGTNETWISLAVRHEVEKLTVNQLFRYLIIISPGLRMMIATD